MQLLHFWALVIKRVKYFKRDLKGLICEIFLPCLIVVFGLSIMLTSFIIDSPKLKLDIVDLGYGFPMKTIVSGSSS